MMERTVAHYNLLDLRGEGRLGEVYRARDTKVGRTVALKLVGAAALSDGSVRSRFFEDARAAATLSHPNIATLFDVGEHEGGAYLAYEYATGVTVREEMAGQSVAPRRTIDIAIQIADALADGHAAGIVHGNVSPDNIIITPKGSAKLLEFGMSGWTDAGMSRAAAAATPERLGPEAMPIVSYMSPEQALGGKTDSRTDIFSLGVVLYEMLTGRHPFAASGIAATIVNIIQATPPGPSAVRPDISRDLDTILGRALAKDISARQESAASLSAELRIVGAVLDVRSGDPGAGELIPIGDAGNAAAKWIATLLVLAALVAAMWFFVRS
jgi:eukaryotic-like serine/threonine-protein kinase